MSDVVTWLRAVLDEDERMTASEPDDWRMKGTYTDHFTADWVLADIAAKRAILDLHHVSATSGSTIAWLAVCEHCHCTMPCTTVRLLASAYAHRPGWQEEWRPA